MTAHDLAERLSLQIICEPEPEREVTGGYTGDLLSWVMGRAESGDAWLTIMSNQNVVAVASLADPSSSSPSILEQNLRLCYESVLL